MLLEDLRPEMRVRGVVAGQVVQLIAVILMGADAVRVVFGRADGSVDQQMLMRANEQQLVAIEERPTIFDAEADDFKLAAEALRIRMEATDVGVIDGPYRALPHQLEAVYRHLLEQIPLRFLLADPDSSQGYALGLA